MSHLARVRPVKAFSAALALLVAVPLSGCLGISYGLRTQAILAREKDLPRNPETGILKGGNAFFLPGGPVA